MPLLIDEEVRIHKYENGSLLDVMLKQLANILVELTNHSSHMPLPK